VSREFGGATGGNETTGGGNEEYRISTLQELNNPHKRKEIK